MMALWLLAERAEKAAAEAKKQEEADAKAAKEAQKAARLVSVHSGTQKFSQNHVLIIILFRNIHTTGCWKREATFGSWTSKGSKGRIGISSHQRARSQRYQDPWHP